ncbi:hypothetical protein Nepgr_006591 [Nepenthes gracilis]|uniref:Uncharacterized protein n=1 Tax=Nepenthes gracilis TaxID=150966 RepID=A0AAD3S5I0_NEPGR|nr:hypothetical protein Nepgr_006591 [Nepenthes gracilis]
MVRGTAKVRNMLYFWLAKVLSLVVSLLPTGLAGRVVQNSLVDGTWFCSFAECSTLQTEMWWASDAAGFLLFYLQPVIEMQDFGAINRGVLLGSADICYLGVLSVVILTQATMDFALDGVVRGGGYPRWCNGREHNQFTMLCCWMVLLQPVIVVIGDRIHRQDFSMEVAAALGLYAVEVLLSLYLASEWSSLGSRRAGMILFGSASLMPSAQSTDCGAEDSCVSLGIYCCIDDRRLSLASVVPPARALGIISASPSPLTFHSSYTNSLLRLALPESIIDVQASQGELEGSSHQSEILDCVVNVSGPSVSVPSLDVTLSGQSFFFCQDKALPSVGLPGEINDSVHNFVSSFGDFGSTCSVNPQDSVQFPCRNEQPSLDPLLDAPVNTSISPASINPLGDSNPTSCSEGFADDKPCSDSLGNIDVSFEHHEVDATALIVDVLDAGSLPGPPISNSGQEACCESGIDVSSYQPALDVAAPPVGAQCQVSSDDFAGAEFGHALLELLECCFLDAVTWKTAWVLLMMVVAILATYSFDNGATFQWELIPCVPELKKNGSARFLMQDARATPDSPRRFPNVVSHQAEEHPGTYPTLGSSSIVNSMLKAPLNDSVLVHPMNAGANLSTASWSAVVQLDLVEDCSPSRGLGHYNSGICNTTDNWEGSSPKLGSAYLGHFVSSRLI